MTLRTEPLQIVQRIRATAFARNNVVYVRRLAFLANRTHRLAAEYDFAQSPPRLCFVEPDIHVSCRAGERLVPGSAFPGMLAAIALWVAHCSVTARKRALPAGRQVDHSGSCPDSA